MSLSITEFRDVAENLSRFANTREKAEPPHDRILIQMDGVLKFVAANEYRTLIADTGKPVEQRGKALVNARLLLSAAKTLKGKGSVDFSLDGEGGATMRTSFGGKIVLPRVGDGIPNWVRPEGTMLNVSQFHAGFLQEMVRYVEAGTSKFGVLLSTEGKTLKVQITDNYMYATTTLPLPFEPASPLAGWMEDEFVKACRGLKEMGTLWLGERTVEVRTNRYAAVNAYRKSNGGLPEPAILSIEPDTWVTTDRKALIEAVKSMSVHDEHTRIVVELSADGLHVRSFSDGDHGEVVIPAESEGRTSQFAAKGEFLGRLLKALPDKQVTIGWAEGGALHFKEGNGWRVYLAPVAL